jgi:3-methyladenine DNA glycosylase AlkD
MLHPAKARLVSPVRAAVLARRQLEALAQPSGTFDARRYFRGPQDLRFHNVGARIVREMARTIAREQRGRWTVDNALEFANTLISDRHLETKGLAIETLARYRRDFTPRLLPVWKQWLAKNHSANWATTDAICGSLIGPLLVAEPALVSRMPAWSRHHNMWVRRASMVALIPSLRKGAALDVAYGIARHLHADREDLIQKAAGWMLREAGKPDPVRLEQYLRAHGAIIPRTTVRYAIERFSPSKRRQLLAATKSPPSHLPALRRVKP